MTDKRFFKINLVEYVSIKYLPLNFFDDETSQRFYGNVNGNLKFPKRTAMTEFVALDGWTSIRGRSYYSITVHYIDDCWSLQSLALDFIPSKGKHSGADIATMFFKCLKECKLLDKLQGITVDNASVNTTFMNELQILMERNGKTFDPENQHFHCFPHAINLSVQALLKELKVDEDQSGDGEMNYDDDEGSDDDDEDIQPEDETKERKSCPIILRLRNICKKLRKSEQLTLKLKNYCQAFDEKLIQIPLDVSTRWNSTHDMLAAGLKMRKAISALANNEKKLNHLVIDEAEWELLDKLQKYLKSFKQFSTLLGGDKYPTLPAVIVGANILLDKLEKLCHSWDQKPDRSPDDERLIIAFQAARDKLIKYYNLTNWIYGVVLILDPRHKLESFDKTPWGKSLKDASYKLFEEILRTDYNEDNLQESSNNEEPVDSNSDSDEEYNKQMKLLYGSRKKEEWRTELSNYLSIERASMDEDILEWWSTNAKSFPRLARMARDYLAICASSVPSERLFSKAGLIIRKHRSRLSNKNAEYLLCMNSWFSSPVAPSIKDALFEEKHST